MCQEEASRGAGFLLIAALVCLYRKCHLTLFSNTFSPWAMTLKIGFFVPIGGTSAIMEFLNLHLSKFKKIHDISAESVAILVK